MSRITEWQKHFDSIIPFCKSRILSCSPNKEECGGSDESPTKFEENLNPTDCVCPVTREYQIQKKLFCGTGERLQLLCVASVPKSTGETIFGAKYNVIYGLRFAFGFFHSRSNSAFSKVGSKAKIIVNGLENDEEKRAEHCRGMGGMSRIQTLNK